MRSTKACSERLNPAESISFSTTRPNLTPDTLHRIDAEILKEVIAAVGFVLEDESDVLARPDDDRSTHSSYETAQLILKFRKPE